MYVYIERGGGGINYKNTTIPSDLFQTLELKFAAIRYLTNRLVTNTMNNMDKM